MKPSFCDSVSCFSILNSKYFKLCMVGNPLVQCTDNYKELISTLDKNSIKLSTLKGLTTIQALQKNEYAKLSVFTLLHANREILFPFRVDNFSEGKPNTFEELLPLTLASLVENHLGNIQNNCYGRRKLTDHNSSP